MDSRFENALRLIDEANARDPNRESVDGVEQPKELIYSQRMTSWLEKIAPDASDALRLAARAQHICRWKIPRNDYPMDRVGYHRWRKKLANFHSDTAGKLLVQAGYDCDTIERVQALVQKQQLKSDPETQTLEDAVCLVFLEDYFADFSQKHDDKKLVRILRKTWAKMSSRGHQLALGLDLDAAARALIEKALSGP